MQNPFSSRRVARATALVLLLFASTGFTLAVDGVIEINQTRALAGDVTPGDLAGFPIWISESGSYRLTSDLVPPPGISGISIFEDDVTLDLNGFSIVGSGEVGTADGISFDTPNVEIKNGSVRGFLRHGIFGVDQTSTHARIIGVRVFRNFVKGIRLEGEASLVDQCTVFDNFSNGIWAGGDASLVINSVIQGNTLEGLHMSFRSGYRSNTLTDNNGGNVNPQVVNGIQLGTNLCGNNTVCP